MEKTKLKLGFIPLTDCAPLVVAKERGFFAEQGLDVDLSREASWASIRDKVAVGTLDGAHMLATMPMSTSLGLAGIRQAVVTACALNLGGNTITLSAALIRRMGEPTNAALKRVIDEDKARGLPPMAFAMVYPFSTHHYELRYWMAAAGIDPDRDVRLVVVPPPQMVGHLSAGNIQGFCVGEPWGSLAASMELGQVVATSTEIFAGRIEKVLGVTQDFADTCPQTHKALVAALIAAGAWCDANRAEVAEIIAQPAYVNVPIDVARQGLAGENVVFSAHAANFPWRSQAMWLIEQMKRWGHVNVQVDTRRLADLCYRPDLYRLAALGNPVPLCDHKTEGLHATPWVLDKATAPIAMGPDSFLDGAIFDPLAPADALPSAKEIQQ